MRKWEIFVIQHSHIDIGYTERQELIGDYHRQFLEQAVAFALSPRQSKRDEAVKFRFTCEGFWTIEQFLANASKAQVSDFHKAVKLGYIELTAFYAHFTELMDENTTRRMLSYAADYAKSIDYHLDVAMSCDVNGFCWGMADMLYDAGMRYLMTHVNSHHGGYPFDKPFVPFYWEAPSGKKILTWNGITYHKANLMGLVPGLNPDGDLGVPGLDIKGRGGYTDVQDLSIAEKKVFAFTEGLKKQGYERDFIALNASGLYTDNSPPTDAICEHLEKWNSKHGDRIHIRTATVKEFFRHLEASSEKFPTWKGDWNDWWSDGVASTPAETMIFRRAQRAMKTVKMLDPQHAIVPEKDIAQIDKQLITFAEHTWGYAYSVPLPWELKSLQILSRKCEYAYSADRLAHAALDRIFKRRGLGAFNAERPLHYLVINPLREDVKSPVELIADYWEASYLANDVKVVDKAGAIYPCQIQRSGRDFRIEFIANLKAGETKEYFLDCKDKPRDQTVMPELGQSYENAYFRMKWEIGKGICSLVDKTTGLELLGNGCPGLCSPVYQVFPVPGNDQQNSVRAGAGVSKIRPQDITTVGELTKASVFSASLVYTTLEFIYKVPGASLFNVRMTFYNECSLLNIEAHVNKDNVWDPEGLYVCFPFKVEDGVWHLDKAMRSIRPGIDQLPKTCCDYYLIQEGAVLSGSKVGIVWSSPDAPLVQLGHLRLWEYNMETEPTGALYSWLTNNKWETNFKASCGGFYRFAYTMEAGKMFRNPSEGIKRCGMRNYPPLSLRK